MRSPSILYKDFCEGCESKKCKIAVVCAHARVRDGKTLRKLTAFHAALSQQYAAQERSCRQLLSFPLPVPLLWSND